MTLGHPVTHRLARLALQLRALDFDGPARRLGDVTLLPHQETAVRWLLHRIRRHHGALLADPPGLGKTYVALAVAQALGTHPLVIGPASLRTRWHTAARDTGVTLTFLSTERLSAPATPHIARSDFVIIDEAHHLRTPATRRFDRTTALCRHADVLLLSATPIHNHHRDLETITSLFHLPPTRASAATLRQRLTLRRTLPHIDAAGGLAFGDIHVPTVRTRDAITVRAPASGTAERITALPALATDGAEAHRLLQVGLLHAWRSSDAAATARIRQRIAVTLAMESAARDHTTPTASLRKAFQTHDGNVQLAMTPLLSSPDLHADPRTLASAVAQRHALEGMLPGVSGTGDAARARVLRRLARWSRTPVVAFTQFESTASAISRHLRTEAGVAWLSGDTAHITTGPIPRDEALERLLAPHFRGRHDGLRLLITTDVVSEGLSLAGVGLVVHLDLPWTAARLDQRIGRAARIGAPVDTVHVTTVLAPIPQRTHTDVLARVMAKRRRMALVDADDPTDLATIRLCRRLRDAAPPVGGHDLRWLTVKSPAVSAPVSIAEVRVSRVRWLVATDDQGVRRPQATDWAALAESHPAAWRAGSVARVRRALRACLADRELLHTVSHTAVQRLQSRRDADAQLVAAPRAHAARSARHATVVRRAAMLDTRHLPRAGNPSGAVPDVASAPGCAAIRIRCGVTILPHT